LGAEPAVGNFLQGDSSQVKLAGTVDDPVTERPGTVIGPYKLMEQIGEGGMGLVFVAEQQQPVRRKVALKLIKPGMDTRQVVARFEAERQALALMDHPNIAKVLDGGETASGRPYFVMELVKGVPITEYCDQNQVPIRDRLELFLHVCQAVQHAHQKGIIHRDIKPSNVLVMSQDGTPVVKVIDFGVAKAIGQQLTEKTIYTQFAQLVGTPLYMSPEQAGQSGVDVDTRSDIYSLGVLLYELLTGTTPFDKERLKEVGLDELRRIIREEEPAKPSTRISTLGQAASTVSTNRRSDPKQLSRLFRGELDWIVMKTLEKDRNRRYETANGFAADVQRYLNDEPVQACPPSMWYRFRKFARRNKRALAVAGVVVSFIALLGIGSGWVIRDRAVRQQRLTDQVEKMLDDVDHLAREQRWPEALAAAKSAEAAVAGGEAGDALMQRVSDVRHGLAFVTRLDRIREDRGNVRVKGRFPYSGAARDYALAFRDYGVDVDALPADEAVARLRRNPALAVPVAAALDDWAGILGDAPPRWKRVVAVARGLDPDPLRDQLRAAWVRPLTPDVQAELRRLAESIDVKAASPATLLFLAHVLRGARLPDSAVRILRDGQSTHTPDFWLNFDLAYALWQRKEYAEAARYYTAAVSIRPDSAVAHNNLGNALRDQKKLDEAIAEHRRAIELDPKSAAAHCNFGADLHEQGKLEEAMAEFRKAIELDPKHAMAHSNLGGVLSDQGKLDQAVTEHRKAIALAPKWAWAYNNLAFALDKQGKVDEAIACYRKAIALDPKAALVHDNLGLALQKQGKWDDAMAEHRKATALDPKSAPAHNNLGVVLSKQGKLDEAMAEWRLATLLDPKFALPHVGLGSGLHDHKKLDRAIAAYRKAIELDPKLAVAHIGLSSALRHQGKLEEAVAEGRKAIELDPKDADAHANLGNALRSQGKLEQAVAECRKAIQVAPKHAKAHGCLGNALMDQRKLAEGIAEFRRAIELDPKFAGFHCNLAIALERQGKLDDAIVESRKAVELDPKNAENHYNLGFVLFRQGKLDEAIVAYRKAVELQPSFAEAHKNLGDALRATKDLDGAIHEYLAALKIEPNNFGAHNNLGLALDDKKDLDGAIREYGAALKIDPNSAGAHNNLAGALRATKDLDGAIREYRAALKIDPNYAEAHFNLGNALRDKKDLDGAIREYGAAIKIDPNYASAHKNLGNALRDKKDLDGAIREYHAALKIAPNHRGAHYNLGIVLCDKKDLEGAIREYRAELKIDPNFAGAHVNLGLALKETGDVEGAIREYRAALKIDPNHALCHNNLGIALFDKGRLDKAIIEYLKAIELDPKFAMPHYNLGNARMRQGRVDEAFRLYQKALALDPQDFLAHNNLGVFLCDCKQDYDRAIAEFQKAIALAPRYAPAHYNLGLARYGKGDLDGAIVAHRKAIQLDPKFRPAHVHLGNALGSQGKKDEAIAEYREAIRIDKDDPFAHNNLANLLTDKDRPDEAIAECREAIRINKEFPAAHCSLGRALKHKGQFRQALQAYRRGHELGSRSATWRFPSAKWVRQCERLIELDEKLPGFLQRKTRPASAAERIELAQLCALKRLTRASANFYAAAFGDEPKLADDLRAEHRYNAACVAALAGSGVGKDAHKLDEKQKAHLRGQALGWLRADLALRAKHLSTGESAHRAKVRAKMRWWLADPDLIAVRGPNVLAKLPEAERREWQKLWNDVADMLKRAQRKTASEKK
jgi:serine/threonine-protein kinase